jgi:hypothetical protein
VSNDERALIEVLDVVESPNAATAPYDGATPLVGWSLDWPEAGSRWSNYTLTLWGWALTTEGPPSSIRVDSTLASTGDAPPLRSFLAHLRQGVERADVPELYPEVPGSDRSGFLASISTLALPHDFELTFTATLADGRELKLGSVRGRRERLVLEGEPRFTPILLTAPGRSGTHWLIRLLGQHPQIVAYEPFVSEPRIASYWAEVLRTLSHPNSYSRAIQPPFARDETEWWLPGKDPSLAADLSSQPEMERWLTKEWVEELAAFCRHAIEGFYGRASSMLGKTEASWFVERAFNPPVTMMIQELFPELRELFLIRDPRDLLCSRLAYMRKSGFHQFGREAAESDEDYACRVFAGELEVFLQKRSQHGDRAPLVRYEDLIRLPVPTLQDLFAQLELDSSAATVNRVLEESRVATSQLQKEHRTSAGDLASIGRWRDELPPRLRQICEQSLGALVRELGY